MIWCPCCSVRPFDTYRDTTALIWVQTESASTVEVLGCSASTFEVQGYHFALVPVTGLPDTITEYQVMVDGRQVWPLADSPFPPP